MSLLAEIKRRRVFRLAAAYAVVSWVIVQIVTAIEEPLNLPEWFDTMVIVMLGLGFPIALMLSWAYDITPDGIVKDGAKQRALAPIQFDYGKVALGAVLLLGAFLLGNFIKDSPTSTSQPKSELRRFEISTPSDFENPRNAGRQIAVAPDGQTIVLQATVNGTSQLFRRRLDSIEVLPIMGTEGAGRGFAISPDSKSIAFVSLTDRLIKKVSLSGGIPTPLVDVGRLISRISWGSDDNIVYTDDSYVGLLRVSAAGSPASKFSVPEDGEQHKHASYIPGSDWLVFAIGNPGFSVRSADRIALMSPDGVVQETSLIGSSPRVSQDGYLIYFSGNALWAVAFDLDKFEISGDPSPLVDDIYYSFGAHFDISREGTLVHMRDSALGNQSVVWVDHRGIEEVTPLTTGRYSFPTISPDGDMISITEVNANGPDLWTHSLSRGEATQWTFDTIRETMPLWSPDGAYLYFEAGATGDVFRVDFSGQNDVEQITDAKASWYPSSITPDGRYLIVDEWNGSEGDGNNLGVLDLSEDRDFRYLMKSDYRESHARLSPDGTLLAYMSDRSGALEVYVRPYPFVDEQSFRVSVSGDCWSPRWSADGRKLYYWDRDDETIYSVQLDTTSPALSFAVPVALFNTERYQFEGITNYDYDRSRNKFLMIKNPLVNTAVEIVYTENWQSLVAH